LSGRRLGP